MAGRRRAPLRAGVLGCLAVVVLPLASAFACVDLATIELAQGEARPGDQVAGTGKGFADDHGGAPGPEPVVVRFGSATGSVVWSGRPAADHTIAFSFTVPAVPPGEYLIVAMQTTADGTPAPGTPARDVLTVVAAPEVTTTTTATTSPPTTAAVTVPPAGPAPTAPPAEAPPATAAPPTPAVVRTGAVSAATARGGAATATPAAPAAPPASPVPPAGAPTTAPAEVTVITVAARPQALATGAIAADGDGPGTPRLLWLLVPGALVAAVVTRRTLRARRPTDG